MPSTPKKKIPIWGWFVLLGFASVPLWLLYLYPWALAFAAILAIVVMIVGHFERNKIRQLALERDGEGICTFARSFERRQTDTWILRAVYEELSSCLKASGYTVPIRADDRFKEDFFMDDDDLADVAEDIAFRAGRSLANVEPNPLFGKVETVRDLVRFLEHQPKHTH